MKVLIITQKIDTGDAVLGFMNGWISECAKYVEGVVAICLEKGVVDVPENVRVLSLGKEAGRSRISYIWNFFRYIIQQRNTYDVVFVHMNAEYVVLGGLLWRLFGKKVSLWYAHKSVTWYVRVAEKLCHVIFTSTMSGFRLPSRKVRVIGQGIDTDKFHLKSFKTNSVEVGHRMKIISVGRISPSKDYETLIRAAAHLKISGAGDFRMSIVGPVSVPADKIYKEKLKELLRATGLAHDIIFEDSVPNKDLPDKLAQYDLFVNMGQTGSLDKAVPEAMAVGLPILTCNEAFLAVLGPFTGDLMYPKADSKALAEQIQKIMQMDVVSREKLGKELREIVVKNHSLQKFIGKIISGLAEL